MMLETQPRTFRWDVNDYYKLGEAGWFDGKRVELIEGEIIEMSPIGSLHWAAVNLVAKELTRIFATGYVVSVQSSLRLSGNSQPEPDVAVIAGDARDFKAALPTTAALTVEVSDSTLAYDRSDKVALYAKAGIPEYWIVNLVENQLEVYRQPKPASRQEPGYASVKIFKAGDTISPLLAPHASITITELLP